MLFGQFAKRVERLLADHDQLALKRVLIGTVVTTRNDALAHDRHRIDHSAAQAVERRRHVPPAHEALTFLGDEFFELFGNEIARSLILREEALRDSVVAGERQVVSGLFGPFADQRIRHLQQNAGTVTEQRIGADGTAMIEVRQNFQRLPHDCVRLFALDVRDETDAARIVFVTRIVQTCRRGKSHPKNPVLSGAEARTPWPLRQ
ncbi:hypothetical protein AM2010_2644 [Pelagerythrobacter marensis]|uniref:Uncharacterized protein n=1 Tax=Pelagerythrobacter marensis TaxID=543877 RepID=A0A0G3XDN2_9SPHN|nr:hypothetical protein AM2010_2644 [Pelagerythrobacter marensis]